MSRIETVQKLLRDQHLDAIIIDHPIDLYYLLSQEFSLGRLVIEPSQATLFVDGRYYESARSALSLPVELTYGYGENSHFFKESHLVKKKVGFDADTTTYALYEDLRLLNAELIPLKSPIKKIREVKKADEIETLKRAAALNSRGLEYLLSELQEGISEKELVKKLEIFWLAAGADRAGFVPHIAFGDGSSQPHYHSSDRRLKNGETILIDIGVVVDHYHSDMTRVVAFGTPHKKLQEIYAIVYEAYCAAVALCKPGMPIANLDQAARAVIDAKGYGKYFSHGLGHGVGLEIHELPRVNTLVAHQNYSLEEGMVLTIEPGIYLSGIGGVRLEDTLVITSTGSTTLSQHPLSATLPQIHSAL